MNRKSFFIPASLLIAAVLLFSCGSKELLFTEGTGSVPFSCRGPYAGKTIEIYYHIPAGDVRTMPVQVVMHGMAATPTATATIGRNLPTSTDSSC